jgi:hypothetical protein
VSSEQWTVGGWHDEQSQGNCYLQHLSFFHISIKIFSHSCYSVFGTDIGRGERDIDVEMLAW